MELSQGHLECRAKWVRQEALNWFYSVRQAGYYVVIEEQSQWVREIYRRYAGGCSLQDLCKWLNSSSVPTPQGGQYWASPTVRLILKNEVNKAGFHSASQTG